jgi:hypothetical protein
MVLVFVGNSLHLEGIIICYLILNGINFNMYRYLVSEYDKILKFYKHIKLFIIENNLSLKG